MHGSRSRKPAGLECQRALRNASIRTDHRPQHVGVYVVAPSDEGQSGRACAEPPSRPSAPRSGGGAQRRALTAVSTREHCRPRRRRSTTTSCGRPSERNPHIPALANMEAQRQHVCIRKRLNMHGLWAFLEETSHDVPHNVRKGPAGGRVKVAAPLVPWRPPTACRSGEARLATWNEIDMEAREWRIPGDRMKTDPSIASRSLAPRWTSWTPSGRCAVGPTWCSRHRPGQGSHCRT